MKEQKVRVENKFMSRHITVRRGYDISHLTTDLTHKAGQPSKGMKHAYLCNRPLRNRKPLDFLTFSVLMSHFSNALR